MNEVHCIMENVGVAKLLPTGKVQKLRHLEIYDLSTLATTNFRIPAGVTP